MSLALRACGLLASTFLAAVPARAQAAAPDPLQLPRFAAAPKIDGILDEPEWQTAATIEDFVETWPGDNAPPPRPTRVRLGVDATNLYVAIEADDEPGAVRATLARRDDVLADDHLRFLFDTFDDRRHAYVVALNPFGIAQDGVWVEGRDVDYSFDLLLESKGRLTPRGYTVELALLFSSLRTAAGRDHPWGLHVFRKIHHLDGAELSWRRLERGRTRVLEQEGRIAGFVEQEGGARLEAIPTWTATRERVPLPGAPAASDDREWGGTLRWALGQAMVVDAAIQPDFAQVEADQPVVTANQRFPLFFAEKRPFFLEGTEIFQTDLAILNTRAIVAPSAAVKATGKRGAVTAGALVARDRQLAGDADLAVLRVAQSSPRGEVGLLATGFTTVGRDGEVLALDGRFDPDARTALKWQVAGTRARRPFYDPDRDRSVVRDGNGLAYAAEARRTSRLRTYTLRGEGRSPDYVADLGFTRQVDLQRWSVTARHDAEPRPAASAGPLRSWSVEGVALAQTDWSGRPTYAYLYPQLHLRLARQTTVSLFTYLDFLEVREEELGPRRGPEQAGAFAGEPVRRTTYHGLSALATTAPSERLSISASIDRTWHALDYDFGGGPAYPRVSPAALADPDNPDVPLDPGPGRTFDVSLQVDWRPTDALRCTIDLSRSTLTREDTRLVAYDQRLATARLTYQLTRAIFARVRGSYDSLAGTSLGEALLAWTPSPGTAIYVGYEEPAARDPRRYRPADPFAGWTGTRRTAFVKLSYRFGRDIGRDFGNNRGRNLDASR